MAETLKAFFSPALVKRLAADLVRVHPSFPERPFVQQACSGLSALELLDRGRHIARVLAVHLPPAYPDAVAVLLRSLGPEHATDELVGAGLAPFFYLPHVVFVAERGLDHFDLWAARVPWLDEHPGRVLELLELLKDDPSTLVRRCVANNLNDLGKVWPDLLAATAAAWLESASPERRALVEHALRSAVKRGNADALRLLGYGTKAAVSVEKVRFDPARLPIGGRVSMSFILRSRAPAPQALLVDVAVHFVKARGAAARVFKVGRLDLPPGIAVALRTTFSLAVHTTRVPRPGRHAVDVLVNGEALKAGSFQVTSAREPPRIGKKR